MAFDPIILEILNNKIAAAADEMCSTLQRASRSTFVKEAADFGVGISAPAGYCFGYPPAHSIQYLMDSNWGPTLRKFPNLEPGDVIVTNDPYRSEGLVTHLPDLYMARPYFWGRRIACFGWAIIHFTDVGGRVPSSISPSNHEIFQEGIIFPPMKIVRCGVLSQDFVTVFTANCRTPDINMGDVKAMLGSLDIGRQRVEAIIERHGFKTFMAVQEALREYSAAKARQVFRLLPDGVYEFWDYMDDDLVTAIPIRFRVRLTVDDGRLHLDFTGTDPAVLAAYNMPTAGLRHWWLTMRLTTFLLSHDPSLALNDGMYRSVSVTNPAGTVLHAEFPTALGIRSAPGRRVNDAVNGAILKAAPDKLSLPSCGAGATVILIENDDQGHHRHVLVVEPVRGGMGAMRGQDGVDARDSTMNNMRNHPVEAIETEGALIIREYDVRPDSGGPGRWRGGVGQLITVEVLRDNGIIMIRGMERLRFPAWGIAGGKPGSPFAAIFNKGRADERSVTKIDELPIDAGDTITFLLPGAGGYGDPYERDAEAVRRDVELGFVSLGAARRDYGVAIGANGVDAAATRRLRKGRRKAGADFEFGPEREAWESVFDDATLSEINRRLMALPRSARYETRRRLFESALPRIPVAGEATVASVLTNPEAARRRLAEAMKRAFGGGNRGPV
ncbi:MAG: hydantoinase B/oxoprolinase family protein [Rhodospirillales bacterium]|jgi:N-methylhydantoinase B|nr:hydantoinase B/oxoprolinase family protein [Rhodospirillales bacterium]